MVTENGDVRCLPPPGNNGTGLASRRKAGRPLPLTLTVGSPPASRPHSPSVYPPNSARFPPHTAQLHPIHSPQDLFFPHTRPHEHVPVAEPYSRPPLPSPTFPDPNIQGRSRDGEHDQSAHRRIPPRVPNLRISKSMSRLNTKQQNYRYYQDNRYNEVPSHGLGLPRVPSGGHSDYHAANPLRSSVNSIMTSRSSTEQASGTERSSVLTKASSFTDLSPDTPGGPYDDMDDNDEGMSVEDAIAMYMDGFSDVPEEPRTPDIFEDSKAETPDPQRHQEPPTDDEEEEEEKGEEHMYEDGHTSEEHSPHLKPSDPSGPSNPPVSLGSLDDSLPSPPLADVKPSVEPPRADQQASRVILPGVVPPPFLRGTGPRDRYGFRKATHYVTLEQYEAWDRGYCHTMAHRKAKWVEILQENGLPTVNPAMFPPKSSRVKRFVRKGIPPEYRGAAWFYYAGGYDLMKQNPGHFEKLVRTAMESPSDDDKEHIERDLHRTFPDNLHFKPEGGPSGSGNANLGGGQPVVETQMIQSLRRVLYAFALHNPKVGYTQSLNFIAGLLLLFLPEENAFWMLHIVTSEYLPGTHEISLEGANVDLWILMVLLRESLPHIYAKISSSAPRPVRGKPAALTVGSRLPDVTLGLTNWLMSLFIGSLPLETTLRVWDVLFYEGSKTFFRVALAIFKACEKDILAVSDPMEVFQVIQTAPKKLLDANALMEECFARKLRVGQSRVEDLRVSRRAAVREEKSRLSLTGNRGPLQEAINERPTRTRTPIHGLDRGIAGLRHMKNHAFG